MKNLFITILLICTVTTFLANPKSIIAFLCNENTNYAPLYDENAFRQVKGGMTSEEVKNLLGPPLHITQMGSLNYFAYITPPDLSGTSVAKDPMSDSSIFKISFDSSNRVEKATRAIDLTQIKGHSKKEILEKFGEPYWRAEQAVSTSYYYSEPGESGTYHTRIIRFDSDSRVYETKAELYFD